MPTEIAAQRAVLLQVLEADAAAEQYVEAQADHAAFFQAPINPCRPARGPNPGPTPPPPGRGPGPPPPAPAGVTGAASPPSGVARSQPRGRGEGRQGPGGGRRACRDGRRGEPR